ncbi:MAG: alpha/beta hydrolase, partial [Atopobiaceae bacterium]|nr:alpha/beta hydrolase [Atopobiaceae bacterium]
PEGEGPFPLYVVSHGLAGTYMGSLEYAKDLAARGVISVVFDFRGGALASKSSGTMLEMSIMTEAADLEAVLDWALSWENVDPAHVWLAGRSQGAVVSGIVACRRPEQIEKLVLQYPAHNFIDDMQRRFPTPEDVPETFELIPGVPVGAIYALDVLDYDWREKLKGFEKPVLLLHGTEDQLVDPAYSEEALGLLPDAQLVWMPGSPHKFAGEYLERGIELMRGFFLGEQCSTAR